MPPAQQPPPLQPQLYLPQHSWLVRSMAQAGGRGAANGTGGGRPHPISGTPWQSPLGAVRADIYKAHWRISFPICSQLSAARSVHRLLITAVVDRQSSLLSTNQSFLTHIGASYSAHSPSCAKTPSRTTMLAALVAASAPARLLPSHNAPARKRTAQCGSLPQPHWCRPARRRTCTSAAAGWPEPLVIPRGPQETVQQAAAACQRALEAGMR